MGQKLELNEHIRNKANLHRVKDIGLPDSSATTTIVAFFYFFYFFFTYMFLTILHTALREKTYLLIGWS
jgi:hypothetical protein